MTQNGRSGAPTPLTAPEARPRFMSEGDCHELLTRLTRVAQGGGHTAVIIQSIWTGNVRWGRNRITTSGEVETNTVQVYRFLNGATGTDVLINDTSTAGLIAAARRAERLARLDLERPNSDLVTRYTPEQPLAPKWFSETTYQLDATQRAAAAIHLADSARAAGMLSAGYLEVSAHSLALLDTYGRAWYFPYTHAQYSVTVRDPQGTGSGWAGQDHYDWSKIDGPKLSQIALDKCLQSRNPVAVEPGRYTVILEPQAVGDFVGLLVHGATAEPTGVLDRRLTEAGGTPFTGKLGQQVIDERLSISADPMDPELGFPPFDLNFGFSGTPLNQFERPVFHPVTWIEHGVLLNLAYYRNYALGQLGRDPGQPNPGAFRLSSSGPTQSVEEMIAGTKRGLLVTRFDHLTELEPKSVLCRGHTRDGLWLVENGKLSKPVKNLYFTESVIAALNRVETVGVPQRLCHPPIITSVYVFNPQPMVVPPLKLRDFSFTALNDAV